MATQTRSLTRAGEIASGVAFVIVGAVFVIPIAAAQSGEPASKGKTAGEVYKNIEVLQSIPADQLLPTMELIADSLGTQCTHCHVAGSFERDDKTPKDFARAMMKMVFALNRDTFGGREAVTCFTCHRGNLRPMVTMTAADMGRLSPAPGLVGNQPTPDQILDKYLQGVGGMDALAKVNTRVAKGTIKEAANPPGPVEIYVKSPDKRLVATHVLSTDDFLSYSGDIGWSSNPNRGTLDLSAADVEGAKLEDDLYLAMNSKKLYRWRIAPAEKVGDKAAFVIDGTAPGHAPLQLFFDQQTGLLLRVVHSIDTPFGPLPTQVDYSDYRKVDDVQVPFQISTIRPTTRNVIQLDEVHDNVPIEDAKFSKPAL